MLFQPRRLAHPIPMEKRSQAKSPRLERKIRPAETKPRAAAQPASPLAHRPTVPPAPPLGPSPEAVQLFETGMEALQRHVYRDAGASFRVLVTRFPAERALLDRAKVYLDLCERELRRRPNEPQTVEERLTEATAALNNGDEARTERLARAILADDARHDMALYLLAAVEARRGATDAAITYLGRTIEISPEARAQARYDADFEPLRSLQAFQDLVDPPAGALGRRLRRGRP